MYYNLNESEVVTDNIDIHNMLEKEKQNNKKESWNKLDKTMKIQKLHSFAEKYIKENSLPIKNIKTLKHFFSDSLDNSKLLKTKDVIYDKEKGEIISIPSLTMNKDTKNFTLKQCEKRVSTIKSLTPKRVSSKNSSLDKNEEEDLTI